MTLWRYSLFSRTFQGRRTSRYRRRPFFSPSMPLLVFWPLLALRRRHYFSLCALLLWCELYDMRDIHTQNIYIYIQIPLSSKTTITTITTTITTTTTMCTTTYTTDDTRCRHAPCRRTGLAGGATLSWAARKDKKRKKRNVKWGGSEYNYNNNNYYYYYSG